MRSILRLTLVLRGVVFSVRIASAWELRGGGRRRRAFSIIHVRVSVSNGS